MLNLFSKQTKSIKLKEALELKEAITDRLRTIQNSMLYENSVLKGQKRNYNLKKLAKESEVLQSQLVQLKILLQAANLKVVGDEESLAFHIYTLAEKKMLIQNLESIKRKTSAKGMPFTSSDGKEVGVYDEPVYSRPVIEDWVNNLKKECSAIEAKLTKLNNEIIVELPFKTNLI